MKFRANLDPELSELVKKYGLFKEEEDDWNWTGNNWMYDTVYWLNMILYDNILGKTFFEHLEWDD